MVFVLHHIPEGVNYIIAYQHYSIASYMYVMHEWIKGLSAMLTLIYSYVLVKWRWSHLKTTWALVDVWQAWKTSHSKNRLDNFQQQYLPELLVNMYSYHLMVKSVSCCCEHGSWIFSNLVTYVSLHWVNFLLRIVLLHYL